MPLKLGTDINGLESILAAGQKPDYALLWTGAWNAKGWADFTRQLDAVRDANVTPVVQWYYWGEDISPAAVDKGTWSAVHGVYKSLSWWNYLAVQLGDIIHTEMQGKPVIVVLESEFNKHGIEDYPAFDADLAHQASLFRTHAPEARLALGFGNWNLASWASFPRAIAAVDLLSLQTLRGSTRGDAKDFEGTADNLQAAVTFINATFHKPSLIDDLGLSSYGERNESQARTLEAVFARAQVLHDLGLEGIVYRSWQDVKGMSNELWFGEAERHWGLVDGQGAPKPAQAVWLAGLAARVRLA